MLNTTQLLNIAGVPVARHADVLTSLALADDRSSGLLFHKLWVRHVKAGKLAKLVEWEDDHLCVKHPDLIDSDIAPMINIRLCGDNGPWTPDGSRPLETCWLDKNPESDDYKDAVKHNYWCEGEHPRSRKSVKAQIRRNGGEGKAWRLGQHIDVAKGFEIWRGTENEIDVKVFHASGAWLLIASELGLGNIRVNRRVGFELDNIFCGNDTPRMWFPIKGYTLRAPVTWSVIPFEKRIDMSLKTWEKPYFVKNPATDHVYTAVPGSAIAQD